MSIDKELLEILVCPQCKGDVQLDQGASALICDSCRLRYEIREGIPVMLIEEAQEI